MKTSYLLRQSTWMTTDERRVARYIARQAEQAITAGNTPLNPAHACAIFALCTSFAMFQRVQAKLADAFAGDGDFAALGNALMQGQAALLRAQEHLERITARANGIALPEPTPEPIATPTPSENPATSSASALMAMPTIASLLSSPTPVTSGAKPLHPSQKNFATHDERRRRRNANKAARKRK